MHAPLPAAELRKFACDHRRRRGPSSRRSVLRRCQRDGPALGYFSTSTVSFLKIVAPRLTKYLLTLRSAGERLALL